METASTDAQQPVAASASTDATATPHGSQPPRQRKFITSALPYVNNQPHLGNIVGSVLSGDVYARYCRLRGYETCYISGTDEFGTATEMEALRQGLAPIDIVTTNRAIHRRVYEWFNCQFDHFGNTCQAAHVALTQAVFLRCWKNGFFDEEDVEQFYCAHCQQFLADRYVEGRCALCNYESARGDQCDGCGRCLRAADLLEPRCVLCRSAPERRSTRHLLLRLDKLHSRLRAYFEDRRGRWTANARAIYEEWIRKDLHPRSMTRALRYRWGVPVPLAGYEDKVFYVWFDAPLGYFTFLSLYREDWLEWAAGADFVQFMGKDNVPFHSIIFPAMLLAARGEDAPYPLVNVINSTEYLTFNGEKFSKSRGVGIFGLDLCTGELGCADFWRFFLMRVRPETRDADFNIEKFIEHVSSELISNWGNLCNRTLRFILKQSGGEVVVGELDGEDEAFVAGVEQGYQRYLEMMEGIRLREGLMAALELAAHGNKYVQGLQGRRERMAHGYAVCYSLVVLTARVFAPFVPAAAEEALRLCGQAAGELPAHFEVIRSATIAKDVHVLFEPWTKEQLARLRAYTTR